MALSTRYTPLFNETDQAAIYQRIREIGSRLKNPEFVFKISAIAKMQSRYGEIGGSLYSPQSLMQGIPGLSLMYDELDRVLPGEGWDQTSYMYLSHLQNEIALEEFQVPGLFSGLCGFLFALQHLSRGGTRYQHALTQTKEVALLLVNKYASQLTLNNDLQPVYYTLPDGAVGIVAALLALAQQSSHPSTDDLHHESATIDASPHELLLMVEHLSWLGRRDIRRDVRRFDHWYMPSALEIRESQVRWRAAGSAYTGYGMRDGLAGLLAVLSLCMTARQDLSLDHDLSEAVYALAQQIRQGMRKDRAGWYWPLKGAGGTPHSPSSDTLYSWCAGTCGITYALWLAGQALEDDDLRTLALERSSEMYRNFSRHPEMIGPSLNQGIAGMLQVCAHFVHDTAGDPEFVAHLRILTTQLLALFEQDRPFGYRAVEAEFVRTDVPWLLEGAAGVALALSTLVSPSHTGWDRILLLS